MTQAIIFYPVCAILRETDEVKVSVLGLPADKENS